MSSVRTRTTRFLRWLRPPSPAVAATRPSGWVVASSPDRMSVPVLYSSLLSLLLVRFLPEVQMPRFITAGRTAARHTLSGALGAMLLVAPSGGVTPPARPPATKNVVVLRVYFQDYTA